MKKIICVTSLYAVGCTFVDWSIHFLSGATNYYRIAEQGHILLSQNPVTKLNAHGHFKNHPGGFIESKKFIDSILTNPTSTDLISFYPYPLTFSDTAKLLSIPTEKANLPDNYSKIIQYQLNDYNQILDYCYLKNIKVVFVNLNQSLSVFAALGIRSHDADFFGNTASTPAEREQQVQNLFFSDSIDWWSKHNLTNIWDDRERLALATRPFEIINATSTSIPQTNEFLWMDAQSLWFLGFHAMKKIMKFLDVSIDPSRVDLWLNVYREWQSTQQQNLEFIFNVDHIIEAIINNWYYQLDNLTFNQEVIIQHCLIYKHNLNLKTWQLEKFPQNTQDLHKLLEPNIHPIPKLY